MDLGENAPLAVFLIILLLIFFGLLKLSRGLARVWVCLCGAWLGALLLPWVVAGLRHVTIGGGFDDLGVGVPRAIVAGAILGTVIGGWLTKLLKDPPAEQSNNDTFPADRGLLCVAGLIAGIILFLKANHFLIFVMIPNNGWGRFGYGLWTTPMMAIGGAFIGYMIVHRWTSRPT